MTDSQDVDPDDEQIRALPASSLCLQEQQAGAERLQVDHSERENLMQSSSQEPSRTGKPVSLSSCRNRLRQETISDRDCLPIQDLNPYLGSNEPSTRLPDSGQRTKTHLKRELKLCDKSAADSYSTSCNGRIAERWRISSRRILLAMIERKS